MALRIAPTPERLDDLVLECLAEAAPGLAARGLGLTRQMAAVLPEYPLDRPLMKEALGCLLSEAIRSADPSRRLRVTVKANRNALMFAVKAPGQGLSESEREALFSGEARPGTPARARAIISAHGGVAWANGEPGKGITYYFSLPIRQSHPWNDATL